MNKNPIENILIGGTGSGHIGINPRFANRHGLIAGATGTGKTVTLQGLAEGFSAIGVPVFMADVKGDLSGISQPGTPHPKIDERVKYIGINDFELRGSPVTYWDVFGKLGTPVRATVADMGPQLLSRLLDLNETQESVLTLVFEYADKEGLLLLDLKDLRTSLEHISEIGKELGVGYQVSKASVNAILRRLLMLEREGGDVFFGEPSLQLSDFIAHDKNGCGVINVLAAQSLIMTPRVYTTFLLWLISELFENLPEVGDPEKPVLVFFFDEAHLLFSNTSKVLLEKIEQVVRLIRSKGVGLYFVTQSPADLPDTVLGQLGNRIQHGLRAYTPKDQKAVRVAAQTFRPNPKLNTEQVISELGVGEALVSVLADKGVPTPVERVLIRPPYSRMGPVNEEERQHLITTSYLHKRYAETYDPHSAHEELLARASAAIQAQTARHDSSLEHAATTGHKPDSPSGKAARPASRNNRQTLGETFAKSIARSIGSTLGRRLLRGILGSIMKK